MPAIETNICPKIEHESTDHSLQSAWAIWYDIKKSKKPTDTVEFKTQLHKLVTFDTVEGFWKVYCHLKRPSNLDLNVNFHLFRDGIYYYK